MSGRNHSEVAPTITRWVECTLVGLQNSSDLIRNSLVFDTQFLVFHTKFIIFTHGNRPSRASSTHGTRTGPAEIIIFNGRIFIFYTGESMKNFHFLLKILHVYVLNARRSSVSASLAWSPQNHPFLEGRILIFY